MPTLSAKKQNATGKYGNAMYFRTADEIRASYGMLKEFATTKAAWGNAASIQHTVFCLKSYLNPKNSRIKTPRIMR